MDDDENENVDKDEHNGCVEDYVNDAVTNTSTLKKNVHAHAYATLERKSTTKTIRGRKKDTQSGADSRDGQDRDGGKASALSRNGDGHANLKMNLHRGGGEVI